MAPRVCSLVLSLGHLKEILAERVSWQGSTELYYPASDQNWQCLTEVQTPAAAD